MKMNVAHVMETRYNEYLGVKISKNLDLTQHLEKRTRNHDGE